MSSWQVDNALTWLDSQALKNWREAETRFKLPSMQLTRQIAYLLVHEDVQGLLALESELPSLAVLALQGQLQEIFRKQLSERSREIVRLHREGLSKADIAKSLGVSRQLVHNALVRPLALDYLLFLNMTSETTDSEAPLNYRS